MFAIKRVNNKKGQALVEAALIAPLIVFFLFTIIWFGGIMLTWQQLVGAARYGTDLIAYTPYSEKEIEKDVRNYLSHHSNIGRNLDKSTSTLHINVYAAEFKQIDFTVDFNFKDINSFNPMHVIDKVEDIAKLFKESVVPEQSHVVISYKYKVPHVLSAVSGNRLEYITIRAKSEVLARTGSSGENKRRR